MRLSHAVRQVWKREPRPTRMLPKPPETKHTSTPAEPFERYCEVDVLRVEHFDSTLTAGHEWVAEEKVNGVNFSIHMLQEGRCVRFAKRSGYLRDTEFFFGYTSLVPKLEKQVPHFLRALRAKFGRANAAIVYGELIGGRYVHPEVSQRPKFTKFNGQRRQIASINIPGTFHPQYSPNIHFYAYEIKYRKKADTPWILLSPDHAREIFQEIPGLLFAREIFRGSFRRCIAFDIDRFETLIPHFLGIREHVIPANIAEGIVLRQSKRSGEVATVKRNSILKFKRHEFQEHHRSADSPRYLRVIAERVRSMQQMGETAIDPKAILSDTQYNVLQALLRDVNMRSWEEVCRRIEREGKRFEGVLAAVHALAGHVLECWMAQVRTEATDIQRLPHVLKKLFLYWLTHAAARLVQSVWRRYVTPCVPLKRLKFVDELNAERDKTENAAAPVARHVDFIKSVPGMTVGWRKVEKATPIIVRADGTGRELPVGSASKIHIEAFEISAIEVKQPLLASGRR